LVSTNSLKVVVNCDVGIDCLHGSTWIQPPRLVIHSISHFDFYSPIHQYSSAFPPVLTPEEEENLIKTFFSRQVIMLPTIVENTFRVHCEMWVTRGAIAHSYSSSLKYAIYSVAAGFLGLPQSEDLAIKAKAILNNEVWRKRRTLGSIQAALLLGGRECGDDRRGFFRGIARDLIVYFGVHIDPSELNSEAQ
jgi:hypothetical protein